MSRNSTWIVLEASFLFCGKNESMINDPNQFTHDAWEANAEVWDARMGDEGNDFFNSPRWPSIW